MICEGGVRAAEIVPDVEGRVGDEAIVGGHPATLL